MRNLFFLLLFILLCNWSASAQNKLKKSVPFGVNLAGAEFGKSGTGVYGKDYAYPTAADLDYFKSKGLTLIRLPFKWERMQPSLNGELNRDELARLKLVVQEAKKRNLLIIPDLHNYARRNVNGKYLIIGDEGLAAENLANLWGRLAKELKNAGNIYGYGLMNEPHDMLASTPWIKIAQACISEIRKTDNKTPVLVGGNSWSSAERWVEASDSLKNLYDPSDRLIFEAHVYFDSDASGIYRKSYDKENTGPDKGIERVRPFAEWLKQNKLKGFIGEYGVPDTDERWLVCLDNFLAFLKKNGINGTYWAAGPIWHSYKLSVQPTGNYLNDKPQMRILQKYLIAEQ